MKQAVVTIKYDEEKLNAVKQYMGKKDADFDAEMKETLGKCMKNMYLRQFGSTSRAGEMFPLS